MNSSPRSLKVSLLLAVVFALGAPAVSLADECSPGGYYYENFPGFCGHLTAPNRGEKKRYVSRPRQNTAKRKAKKSKPKPALSQSKDSAPSTADEVAKPVVKNDESAAAPESPPAPAPLPADEPILTGPMDPSEFKLPPPPVQKTRKSGNKRRHGPCFGPAGTNMAAYQPPEKDRCYWNESWSPALVSAINSNLGKLNQASDVDDFCPGYKSAKHARKVTCWFRIFTGLAAFESENDPLDHTSDDVSTANIGLYQLSPGNECSNARTIAQLKNYEKNISCAVGKAAELIAKENMISGTAVIKRGKGAGRYWSALRPRYQYRTKKGKLINIGFRKELIKGAKKYMEVKSAIEENEGK